MTTFENLSTSERIRIALQRDVSSVCRECCHYRGFEISMPAIAIISELVFKKISIYGLDLEAFAKHAKRSSINADDVKLLARRNPSLKALLTKLSINNPSAKKNKRKTTADAASKKKGSIVEDMPLQKKPKTEECRLKDVVKEQNVDEAIDLTFD